MLPFRFRLILRFGSGFRVRTPARLRLAPAPSAQDFVRTPGRLRLRVNPSLRSGFRLQAPGRLRLRVNPSPSAQDFGWRLRRRHSASKCNEALSRDLWPLDPFESAPMRATSSGMGYCILCAIHRTLEIKDLAELLSGKAGSNSLPLKKLLCGICWERVFPSKLLLSCNPLLPLF